MQIKELELSEIKPYEKNPRRNDEAVKYVAESIRQFGFKVPVVIDKDNVIVCGHTRYKAAKKLKYKTVPCIMADDLTDEQIKAYRLADNKVSEKAEWDTDLLNFELGELSFTDIDMSDFGFDLDLDFDEEPKEVVDDDFEEELPAEPKAKLGDIYQLGNHRLMCGDSTKKEDIEKLMNGEMADLVLTDPPYGVNIVKSSKVGGDKPFGTTSRPASRAIIAATEYMPIKGDDTTETAEKNYKIIKEFSENQIIFGGNYFTDFLPPSRCWLVWDKGVPDGAFFAPVELAWVSKDGNAKLYKYLWSGLCRQGSRKTEGNKRVHPTQKPVGLIGDILKDFSKEDSTILDCFGGSGSTLIACEQTNRVCYMMEYEPHYVDVIINRWEQLTGKKAVKINA